MILLSNALKFTQEGEIVVRVLQRTPDTVAIEIEDSGIGMSEKELKSIKSYIHRRVYGNQNSANFINTEDQTKRG